jgi:hypothetical protein
MVYDALLRLSGTAQNATVEGAANDNIVQTVTVDTVTPAPVYFGPSRAGIAILRIAGAVGGTTPTLTVLIEAAAAAGGSFIEVARFPVRNSSDASRGTPAGTQQPDRIAFATPADRPFIRANYDVGGTAPSFGGVSVTVQEQAIPSLVA